MTWKEAYTYDTAARPSTIATTIKEGTAVTLNSAMSYDANGRPDTHTYPDGLVVRTLYGPYGQSGGQADGSIGTIWYEITAMDAWNKITAESFMDGTTGTFVDYASSGQQHTASWTLNGNTVDGLTYGYDSLGNLASQYRVAGGQSNTETYVYDQLQRLTNANRTSGGGVSYGYSDSGNLLNKSDFGSYAYAAPNTHSHTGCGPHAVTYVNTTNTYGCDANGNVYTATIGPLAATYDADNHPRTVTRAGSTDTWAYDLNGGMDYESSSRGVRYFGPSGYEQVGTQGIHELGPIVIARTNGANTITTELRDRLGSTIDTIDAGIPNSANTRTYDAFGAVREGNMASRAGGTLNLADTIHGFTKHEHADDVQLIHMGGRIYDYNLGRFLSVDPIIGNPLSSQSLNPYSYVGNNPLGGTDPTGYAACGEISAQQANTSGTCDFTGANGKTTSIGYSFNAKGDVGISRTGDVGAASAAVSTGVLASNGADRMGTNGPSSAPKSGTTSDIGAMAHTVGQEALAAGTNAVRNMFPENAALADQAGSGQQYGNEVGGALLGAYNSLARAANGIEQLGWLGMTQGQYSGPGDMFSTIAVPPGMQRGAAFGEGSMFLATIFAGPERLGVEGASEWAAIGSTGKVGENALRVMGGEPQQYFRTPMGGRFVDQFVGGIANESKVGYQTLTRGNALQIQKDAWLIQNHQRVEGAAWHFYESPVTGRSGPSAPLRDALQQAGIDIFEH